MNDVALHPLWTDEYARSLDAQDPLAHCRDEFALPLAANGQPALYLCSNSLGLMPKRSRQALTTQLDNWSRLSVRGHFEGDTPWYTYGERIRTLMARLVGAATDEVVLMNGLTVNLHLLLASFYRPTPERFKIVVDGPTFPSDLYALQSQLQWHGFNPDEGLIVVATQGRDALVELDTILQREGKQVALLVWNVVNYLTGECFDAQELVRKARTHGICTCLDLAHAVGNVPIVLDDWDADCAVWCTYKYLCGGPGAIAGAYVNRRHGASAQLHRLAGWWGNDPATRFEMDKQLQFSPLPGAAGWQVSNPPVLALAPILASLELFDQMGMAALRAKSLSLTGYLRALLETIAGPFAIITPPEPQRRGCQISLAIMETPQETFARLMQSGVVCDFRPPDVIRLAPAPAYNTYVEVLEAARRFRQILERTP